MRRIVGLIALLYGGLVVAMGTAQLTSGPVLLYAAIAVLVPIAVVAGDRMARGGNRRADPVAQLSLGVIAGMWALPSTSGLVAILALVAGAVSVRSAPERVSATIALVAGILIGVGVLALSFNR